MNILMTSALQETVALVPGHAMGQMNGKNEGSFSNYLEKSQDAVGRHRDNLFASKASRLEEARGKHTSDDNILLSEALDLDAIDTVAGLLQEMMALLQQQAENVQAGPGEWVVSRPDTGILEILALEAGMTESQAGDFLGSLVDGEGQVGVGELLSTLVSHFESLTTIEPITVPDTDFPLFETLLSRMGVETASLEELAAASLTKNDTLDLSLLLGALKGLENGEAPAIPLSDWETEQLQVIFHRAGMSEKNAAELFPRSDTSTQSAALNLQQLEDLLARAIQNIEATKPQTAPVAFLNRLEEIFSQAGFEAQTVGWTPVVQKSLESIYQKLLETIDPSSVNVRVVKSTFASSPIPEVASMADPMAGEAEDGLANMFLAGDGEEALLPGSERAVEAAKAGLRFESEPAMVAAILSKGDATPSNMLAGLGSESSAVQEITNPVSLPRTADVVEQQALNQLSQGVVRGARSNEHHLVLKLFPEDLGEVKVNLHVRHQQIAVSFSMENGQVKEILEQNMQQFRENLEKQGFILEQCSASVDHHDKTDQGKKWQDFANKNAWESNRKHVADLPEDVLYLRPDASSREGGLDFFI